MHSVLPLLFPCLPRCHVSCVCLSAIDYQLSVVSALHFENEAQHQKAVPTAITTKPFLSRNGGSLAQGVDHEATENERENEPHLNPYLYLD